MPFRSEEVLVLALCGLSAEEARVLIPQVDHLVAAYNIRDCPLLLGHMRELERISSRKFLEGYPNTSHNKIADLSEETDFGITIMSALKAVQNGAEVIVVGKSVLSEHKPAVALAYIADSINRRRVL